MRSSAHGEQWVFSALQSFSDACGPLNVEPGMNWRLPYHSEVIDLYNKGLGRLSGAFKNYSICEIDTSHASRRNCKDVKSSYLVPEEVSRLITADKHVVDLKRNYAVVEYEYPSFNSLPRGLFDFRFPGPSLESKTVALPHHFCIQENSVSSETNLFFKGEGK